MASLAGSIGGALEYPVRACGRQDRIRPIGRPGKVILVIGRVNAGGQSELFHVVHAHDGLDSLLDPSLIAATSLLTNLLCQVTGRLLPAVGFLHSQTSAAKPSSG
jgi:hypothetical protein